MLTFILETSLYFQMNKTAQQLNKLAETHPQIFEALLSMVDSCPSVEVCLSQVTKQFASIKVNSGNDEPGMTDGRPSCDKHSSTNTYHVMCYALACSLRAQKSSNPGHLLTCVGNIIDEYKKTMIPSLLNELARERSIDFHLAGGVSPITDKVLSALVGPMTAFISRGLASTGFTIDEYSKQVDLVLRTCCADVLSSIPSQLRIVRKVIHIFLDAHIREMMKCRFHGRADIVSDVPFNLVCGNVQYVFMFKIHNASLTSYEYFRVGKDKDKVFPKVEYKTMIAAMNFSEVSAVRSACGDHGIGHLNPVDFFDLINADPAATRRVCEAVVSLQM